MRAQFRKIKRNSPHHRIVAERGALACREANRGMSRYGGVDCSPQAMLKQDNRVSFSLRLSHGSFRFEGSLVEVLIQQRPVQIQQTRSQTLEPPHSRRCLE